MRHAKRREQLSPYLDGLLEPSRRAELEAHLEGCAECRAELASLRRTVELLHALPRVEPSSSLAGRVMAGVREQREAGIGRAFRRLLPSGAAPVSGWLLPVGAAGLAAAVLLVVQGVEISFVLPGGLMPPAEAPAVVASQAEPVSAFQGVVESARSAPRGAGMTVGAASAAPAPGAAALSAAAGRPAPLPPMASCESPSEAQREACARWNSWLLGLGLRDVPAFLAEIESMPPPARDHWIGRLSDLAAHSGAAPLLANELRAAGDPRASRFANRIDRVSARR